MDSRDGVPSLSMSCRRMTVWSSFVISFTKWSCGTDYLEGVPSLRRSHVWSSFVISFTRWSCGMDSRDGLPSLGRSHVWSSIVSSWWCSFIREVSRLIVFRQFFHKVVLWDGQSWWCSFIREVTSAFGRLVLFLLLHMTKCTLADELIIPCTSGFQWLLPSVQRVHLPALLL